MKQLNNNKGFTFIEIVVTITLMSLLMAFTMPQFLNFNQRSVLIADSNRFLEEVRRTQSLAESGIQDASGKKVIHYRFQLMNQIGSTGKYRGYKIVTIYDSGPVAPLKSFAVQSDDVCIREIGYNEPIVNFGVPSGAVTRGSSYVPLIGGDLIYRVCNERFGYQDIEILQGGRLQVNDVVDNPSSCTCL